jgi:uncharacterized protein
MAKKVMPSPNQMNGVVTVYVQPGAKRSQVKGYYGEHIKIALAAAPIDGRANEELVSFLSSKLAIARSSITIISGERSRTKRVQILGVSAESACSILTMGE